VQRAHRRDEADRLTRGARDCDEFAEREDVADDAQ
jgi:hypothetical protein